MVEPDPLAPLLGRVLDGTYQLDSLLGRGGMGAVFSASHLRTGRAHAVKVLLPEMAHRTGALTRFRREATAVSALGHANIVSVYDFAESDGLAYLVMDRLEGEDLATRIQKGAMSLDQTLLIVRGICSGLHAAHSAGLLHRDLKPANIFLASQPGAEERAVLLDFGLVKSFADPTADNLTLSGVVMGTPVYMSPEQASGQPLDRRSDLYSLASIVFEMLTERPPFVAPALPALFAKLLTEAPPVLSAHRPALTALNPVFARALAKQPEERFPTAHAFLAALEDAASTVTPPSAATRSVPPPPGFPAAAGPESGGPRVVVNAGATPLEVTQAAPGVHAGPVSATAPVGAATSGAVPEASAVRVGILGTLALAAFCVVGALMGLGIYVLGADRSLTFSVADTEAAPQPTSPMPASETPSAGSEPVVAAEPAPAPEPVAPSADLAPTTDDEVAEASPETTRPRRARPARRTRPAAAPPTAYAEPATAAPERPTVPPNMDRSDPVVRATEYSQRGDYAGCVRELRAARPQTLRLLHARFACANSAGDQQEIRDVCAEIMRRNPADPMVPACTALSR